MGRRKRGGAGDALDKAVGRLTETAGTASGDKTLEAEGRATQRIGERKTYVVPLRHRGRDLLSSRSHPRCPGQVRPLRVRVLEPGRPFQR